jgi:hypothetical protein
MAFVVTSNSFAVPTGYIKTNENAIYVASYINAYTKPWHRWWSTNYANGTTYVGVNLGSPTTIVAAAIDNINLDSVKIQGDDAATFDSSGGSPQYDSGALTVSQDVIDGRYKLYRTPISASRQYWRILANSAAPNDGSSVMKVGSFVLLTAVTSWTTNPGVPYEVTAMQAVVDNNEFTGGGREPVEVGHRYCQLSLTQPAMPIAMKSTLFGVVGGYSKAAPFVFYRNDGDTSEVYICRRVAEARIAQAGPAHYSMSGLVLEECV